MPFFSGSDLTCVRGQRLVFRHLAFALEPGAALLVTGRNGSGKSSLLRLMAGLSRPYGGVLSWDGTPIADDLDLHRSRLHYVGHLDAVKPVLSARENLAFWAALGGAAARGALGRADAALERFAIGHVADAPGRYLSAGQRRRLNLARIVATRVPLWLLDEPTIALDREAVAILESVIDEHRANGGMVALSTHAPIRLRDPRPLDLEAFAPADPADPLFGEDPSGDGFTDRGDDRADAAGARS